LATRAEHLPNIDRRSRRPAYLQMVKVLRASITTGEFKPGELLPSESQLCRRYRVSRMTARQAIGVLLQDGLVTSVQGLGTFVKQMQLSSFTFGLDELRNVFSGASKSEAQLLEVRIVEANGEVAEKLEASPGDPVILISRLIHGEKGPIMYHRQHLIYDPSRPIVEAEMEVTALYGLFAGSGESSLKKGELKIKATALSEEEAQLLEAPPMLPSFRFEHLFYDFDDRPVSWGFFVCPGDRMSFRTTVGIFSDPDREIYRPGKGNEII
jgi:DNA-binding GntR family transcriptional regulator